MANGFGTLFIGVSGLQSSQNALNTTANNLANVDTTGYVRQQVLFTDRNYVTFNETTAVSKQQSGLGVYIGDSFQRRISGSFLPHEVGTAGILCGNL